MNKPLATTQLKPQGTQKGCGVDCCALCIDEIPGAMDKMGWKTSAQLMRRWFGIKPAYKMPIEIRTGEDSRTGSNVDYRTLPASQIDDQIVKMAWALKFKPAKEALNKLYNEWCTPNGIVVLRRRLVRAGWQPGTTQRLGYYPNGSSITNAKELDLICQMNYCEFGSLRDTLDDFFGAIYKATMKVAVVGTASYDTSRSCDVFKVAGLGFYIRDTYDFNVDGTDWTGLGVWSKDRVLSKAETVTYRASYETVKNAGAPLPARIAAALLLQQNYAGFVPVANKDFRDWQDKKNEGGDFFVFSDVHWVKPNVTEIIIP
jgi:hypothetical protein